MMIDADGEGDGVDDGDGDDDWWQWCCDDWCWW